MEKTGLRYVIQGSFCSFRDPIGAKYQATFWFPPKTTVIGFLGSALGIEPPDLEPLYDTLAIGMILESWEGVTNDLWGFTKLKGSTKPETAVVIRELIYRPRYAFYIVSDEFHMLERLRKALLDPAYPPRFGRGEDLAMLQGAPDIVTLSSVAESSWLRWTLLPFSLEERSCTLQMPDEQHQLRMPPRSSRMPIRFQYDQDWVRKAEFDQMTQVFDWGVHPDSPEGLWTDGKHTFYLA